MTKSSKLKEAFEVESKYAAFYTGGNIQWIENTLYCQTESCINVLDIDTGCVLRTIGDSEEVEDIDSIHTFTTDGEKCVTSHNSGLLKLWNGKGELEKMWKYLHKGPIASLRLKGAKLASGGADGHVRIWDIEIQACVLDLKGCQGVVDVVEFHPQDNCLFAAGDDGKINLYELDKGHLKTVYNTHFGKVTSIAFLHDGQHFATCGRDKVVVLWTFNQKEPIKVIAAYEAVENLVALAPKFKLPGFKSEAGGLYVASAGEHGLVRVWDLKNAKEVFVQSNSVISKAKEEGGLAVTHLLYNTKQTSVALVTVEQNIVIYHLKSFACLKQFMGFSDEILDVTYLGPEDRYIAVATNSSDIKLYDSTTMSCQLIKGHEDLVLSLDRSPLDKNLLISSGKDNSVRAWQLDGGTIKPLGAGKRHTGAVGSVAFFQTQLRFVSASQDTCLKLWHLTDNAIKCEQTVIGHEKEINCVTVSPNDNIVASSSQDKTVKLWSSDRLELLGVLKGHKRGVWSVRFSPVDQVVVTCSADCTVKLWSVSNLSLLKTFEGHESSVLRVEFVSKGMQLLSVGSDGLVKLFNIKDSECQCTLDQHEGKIWALAIKSDETGFITGGSDSHLIKWRDVTEEQKQQRQQELEEQALQEQKLSNYIHSDQLLKALKLALKLERPMQTLKIIQGVIKKGENGLAETIKSLRNDQKESLMNCALSWNMNSRHSHAAQLVLNILLNELQTGEFRPVGLSAIIEGALPYTERHFRRLTQMMQDCHFLTYTVNCMQPH